MAARGSVSHVLGEPVFALVVAGAGRRDGVRLFPTEVGLNLAVSAIERRNQRIIRQGGNPIHYVTQVCERPAWALR